MATKDFYIRLTLDIEDEAPAGRAEIAALKGIEEALDDGFPVWFEGRGGEEHTLKIADFEISPVPFEAPKAEAKAKPEALQSPSEATGYSEGTLLWLKGWMAKNGLLDATEAKLEALERAGERLSWHKLDAAKGAIDEATENFYRYQSALRAAFEMEFQPLPDVDWDEVGKDFDWSA